MKPRILTSSLAGFQPASDIFVINGATGDEKGVAGLIDLMASHDALIYQSAGTGKNRGKRGLIASDDTIIIKVNGQWAERGGTNTDLLKSVIKAITNHPDGFTGEVIIADNGQGQYGSAGKGGSLDWEQNNAEDKKQSVQKVADSFSSHKVSTYLWDNITTTAAREYSDGDFKDGYVTSDCLDRETGFMVSYPKFKTKFGSLVSLKMGVWNAATEKYDNKRVKLINMPVLKSHFIFGVTGCVKHYMGVVSDKLTASLGSRSHVLVGKGGMGVEMVGTRFPTLNILDAIWINAKPAGGPMTPYAAATRTEVVAASTDPVALDYWAARNILLHTAREQGHGDLAKIDPDNTEEKSFGQWLRLAMKKIKEAGYKVTIDKSNINVYVTEL